MHGRSKTASNRGESVTDRQGCGARDRSPGRSAHTTDANTRQHRRRRPGRIPLGAINQQDGQQTQRPPADRQKRHQATAARAHGRTGWRTGWPAGAAEQSTQHDGGTVAAGTRPRRPLTGARRTRGSGFARRRPVQARRRGDFEGACPCIGQPRRAVESRHSAGQAASAISPPTRRHHRPSRAPARREGQSRRAAPARRRKPLRRQGTPRQRRACRRALAVQGRALPSGLFRRLTWRSA